VVDRAASVTVVRITLTPSTDPATYPFVHTVRTRFAETDAMGVIHHAAYLNYLEEARVAYLRDVGHPYDEVRLGGIDLVVLEVLVRYRRPLVFDEEVVISLAPGGRTGTSFQIAYLLQVGGATRATAVTAHGAVGRSGRPVRLPEWLAGFDTGVG
jgi:acyl-CoA thioester hydrolase